MKSLDPGPGSHVASWACGGLAKVESPKNNATAKATDLRQRPRSSDCKRHIAGEPLFRPGPRQLPPNWACGSAKVFSGKPALPSAPKPNAASGGADLAPLIRSAMIARVTSRNVARRQTMNCPRFPGRGCTAPPPLHHQRRLLSRVPRRCRPSRLLLQRQQDVTRSPREFSLAAPWSGHRPSLAPPKVA